MGLIRRVNMDAVVHANKATVAEAMRNVEYREQHREEVTAKLAEAYATVQGSVSLIESSRIAPIMQEALVTGWVTEFGQVKSAKQGQMPAYRTRSRAKVGVSEVGPNGKTIVKKYANADTVAYGAWVEVTTDPIEIDIFNPVFPDAAAENQAEAHREAAYALNKEMHKRSLALLTAGIATLPAGTWTYKDPDVVGLPTTNSLDASGGSAASDKVELTLQYVAKFFSSQGKSGVINMHIHPDDESYIWGIAPLVQTGAYTPAQEQIFRTGNLLNAYGRQFRIIVENYGVTAGYAWCTIGEPCFDLFIMDMGEFGGVQPVRAMHPKREAFFVTQYFSFMMPDPYKTNFCKVKIHA